MTPHTLPNVADPELGGSESPKEAKLRKENERLREQVDDLKEASRNKSPYETHETVIKPRRSALNAATLLHTSASLFPTARFNLISGLRFRRRACAPCRRGKNMLPRSPQR